MSALRKSSRRATAIGTVPLLLALYAGAYYAMAVPTVIMRPLPGATLHRSIGPSWHFETIDRSDWRFEAVTRFFAPLHWLDRRLRPHAWESPRTIMRR